MKLYLMDHDVMLDEDQLEKARQAIEPEAFIDLTKNIREISLKEMEEIGSKKIRSLKSLWAWICAATWICK